jgi:hypothetical protein
MTVDRRLAFHEAGHVVMAYHLGIEIKEIVMSQTPAYVSIQDQPDGMRWQYLLFFMIGNAIELKSDPVNGWENKSSHDFWCVIKLLEEGTISWAPPGLADDDLDGIDKTEEYIDTFTDPAFDQLEQQAARIIEIPEVWGQISALATVLMTSDRLSGPDVTQFLEMWNHEQRRITNITMQAYRANS